MDDNARCTRGGGGGGGGTRVRRKQLNLVLSSLFLFRGILASSPLPPLFFLFLPLPHRPLPAKLNKHSYLHSISGALTSLDNPATDSSSSHVRTYVRPSLVHPLGITHTSRAADDVSPRRLRFPLSTWPPIDAQRVSFRLRLSPSFRFGTSSGAIDFFDRGISFPKCLGDFFYSFCHRIHTHIYTYMCVCMRISRVG